MDGTRIDALARALAGGMNRRRLFKGLGAVALGGALARFRPRDAAALPYCGNCDQICDNCFESYDPRTGRFRNQIACNVCGHCSVGNCTDVPPQ
jgi:hypothetical protein